MDTNDPLKYSWVQHSIKTPRDRAGVLLVPYSRLALAPLATYSSEHTMSHFFGPELTARNGLRRDRPTSRRMPRGRPPTANATTASTSRHSSLVVGSSCPRSCATRCATYYAADGRWWSVSDVCTQNDYRRKYPGEATHFFTLLPLTSGPWSNGEQIKRISVVAPGDGVPFVE